MIRSKAVAVCLLVLLLASVGAGIANAGEVAPLPSSGPEALSTATDPTCVPDLVTQFDSLKHHGEALGFHRGNSPDPTIGKHYQGIQRLPGAGTPYMFLSRNANRNIGDPISFNEPGNLIVVEFGSRDIDGERLRSNRLERDRETPSTIPPLEDRGIETITFDGNGWPDYRHAGGMQTFGDVLFVALDNPGDSATSTGTIVLVDVSDPTNPTNLMEFPVDHAAGAVAVARDQSTGNILMIVEGPESNNRLMVYRSNVADVRDHNLDFTLIDEWTGDELFDGSWPTGASAHQSVNLLTDCRGTLYLLGTRNDEGTPELGEDHALLYRVVFAGDEMALVQVRDGHFFCVSAAGRICNFVAAAAFYVSPSGELILYGSEHENEGPPEFPISNRTIRMGEFRSRDTYRVGSPLWAPGADAGGDYTVAEGGAVQLNGAAVQSPFAQPWVELYDDEDFGDRSVVIDYVDRFLDDFHNFNDLDDDLLDFEKGFNDKTSAARWAAPVGCNIVLYEHDNFGGDTLVLEGSGEIEEIANFDNVGFGDATSSARFEGEACGVHGTIPSWDLDGDGVFETTTLKPMIDATQLDGPTTTTASFRVCGPFFGICMIDTATVHVSNVAPSLSVAQSATVVHEGQQLTLTITFSDPGFGDSHSLSIDWGDGAVTMIAPITGQTTVIERHVFLDDSTPVTPSDDIPISVTIVDDDGGSDSVDAIVTIANVAPQIVAVTNDGPVVAGSDATVSVAAIDAAGAFDPLTYSFDCDGDGVFELGPTQTPIASCGFGISEGSFVVNVQVADDDSGVSTGSTVVVVPTFLCVNPNSGTVRYVEDATCRIAETGLTLPDDSPVTACIANSSGGLRLILEGECRNSETSVSLPADGPIAVCVNESSRKMRSITDVSECTQAEFARIIAVPLP